MINSINFLSKCILGEKTVEYKNLKEISQGGPEIGELYINGSPILKGRYFSGPLIFQKELNKLAIPLLDKVFFSTKFKMAIIDLEKNNCNIVNRKENLILLKSYNKEGVIT